MKYTIWDFRFDSGQQGRVITIHAACIHCESTRGFASINATTSQVSWLRAKKRAMKGTQHATSCALMRACQEAICNEAVQG